MDLGRDLLERCRVGLAGRAVGSDSARALAIAFTAGAAGLALAGVAPVLVVALAGMAVAGAGRGLGDVAAVTLVQARTLNEVRSRVFAAQDGAAHVATFSLEIRGRRYGR